MGYIIDTKNPNSEREQREKNLKLADERRNAKEPKEAKMIQEIKDRERQEEIASGSRFEFDSPASVIFKSGDKTEILTNKEDGVEKKTETSEFLKEDVRTEEELDLSDYRSEEKFEKLTDFKLDELRENKDKLIVLSEEDKRQIEKLLKKRKWEKMIEKLELKMDNLIKFHPKQVQFVNAEGY